VRYKICFPQFKARKASRINSLRGIDSYVLASNDAQLSMNENFFIEWAFGRSVTITSCSPLIFHQTNKMVSSREMIIKKESLQEQGHFLKRYNIKCIFLLI